MVTTDPSHDRRHRPCPPAAQSGWEEQHWQTYQRREHLRHWVALIHGGSVGLLSLDVSPGGDVEVDTFGLLYAQERTRANDARRDYEPALRKASTTRARRWTQ